MKKKINRTLILTSVISMICTVAMALFVFRKYFGTPHGLSVYLLTVLPVMVVFLAVMCAVSFFISSKLTSSITDPIEKAAHDLTDLDDVDIYPELQPFIATIKKQNEETLRNAEMRQDFTANVSHELKTPLTAISGYAELIGSGAADKEQTVHFASEIKKNADRLLSLINDIIELSELDSTHFSYKFENFDLYELAQTVNDDMQISARKHNVTLSCDGVPVTLCADRSMIEELITNLADNAIRYNVPGGTAKICVLHTEKEAILSVQDTGIGISDEDKEHIFERFYRVDKSRSKRTGGTGLGLAIVKHIAAGHNAAINIFSKPGQGTEIRITFPL